MIVVLEPGCPLDRKAAAVRTIEARGLQVLVHPERDGSTRIGVIGSGSAKAGDALRDLPGVASIEPNASAYPLVASQGDGRRSIVRVGSGTGPSVDFGGEEVPVIAGPCAVESRDQILAAARYVARHGGRALRGGAFKPRTSPYSFQGLGVEGLELLAEARSETGLPIVTEIVAAEDLDAVVEHADMLQIGARNMQNFRLLRAVGSQPKPVLLKRGLIATLDELLHAAEYIAAAGNPNIVLCERGIRTHEPATRNTLDVAAVPWLQSRSRLPVLVDPSHACGRRPLVAPLAFAGVAAGSDGLIVETHPIPEQSLSDKEQALSEEEFASLVEGAGRIAEAVGRSMCHRASATLR